MRHEISRVSTPDQRLRADMGRVLDLEARVKKASDLSEAMRKKSADGGVLSWDVSIAPACFDKAELCAL